MADKVATRGKPLLRGLLHNQIKKNLIVGISLCIVAGIGFKFTVNEPHKKVYADFYKTYDINKAFNQIRNTGAFDSCPPDN